MEVFHFLPQLSGFGCHFKAFDIILAEQPIISALLYMFPLSNQRLIFLNNVWNDPFYSDFQREMHSTTFAAFVLK